MATGMISLSGISNPVISEEAQKIKSEMNDLASVAHDSILRNSDSAVKNFQWETVSTELSEKMPTLMLLLTQLIPKPTKSKPFLCSYVGIHDFKKQASSSCRTGAASYVSYAIW